jgi:hypothetical protein
VDKDYLEKTNKEYRQIAQKDIFFGTPPPVRETVVEQELEADLAPYVTLTTISHNGTGFAAIRDLIHKFDYEIEENSQGVIRVRKYWYQFPTDDRKQFHNNSSEPYLYYDPRYLTFGSEAKGNERAYIVRRIMEDGILVEEWNDKRVRQMKYTLPAALGGTVNLALPGKLYYWRAGQVIKSDQPGKSMEPIVLKPEDKALGLRNDTAAARHQLLRPLQLVAEGGAEEPIKAITAEPTPMPVPKKGFKKKKAMAP